MKSKKMWPVIIIVIGIISIGFSMYVTKQVEGGKVQVADAQQKVDSSKGLFSGNPVTREVGKGLTGGVQKKINEGKEQIAFYEAVASWTMLGGIACIVIGFGTFFLGKRKK